MRSTSTSRPTRLLATVALVTGLAGCLVPEKFSAVVEVKSDGSYNYRYDGTATNLMAAMARAKQGSLSAKDEAALKQEVEKASKTPGIKQVRYLGDGRYELSVDRDVALGKQAEVMPLVTVRRLADGSIELSSASVKEKDKEGLKQLGIKLDGTLEVRLPANAKVLSHNAASTPGLLSKAYKWKIGSVEDRPTVKFELK